MKTVFLALFFVTMFSLVPSGNLRAQEDAQETSRKLEYILANQDRILADLAEVKSELQIIKVRASNG